MKKIMMTMTAAGILLISGAVSSYADSCCGAEPATTVNDKTKASDNSSASTAVKPEKKAQTTCPVLGGTIDRKQYIDIEGKRIYVCCAGCIDTIKADPAKYIRILEDKGVELEKTPIKK